MNTKLTDQDGYTRRGRRHETLWMPAGTWIEAVGNSADMCGPGWIHYYQDPLLAVLFNPIHANIEDPIGWEFESDGASLRDASKSACKRGRVLREIELPTVTVEQAVRWGILCSLQAGPQPGFYVRWAERYLSGDRSRRCPFEEDAAEFGYRAWAGKAANSAKAACEAATSPIAPDARFAAANAVEWLLDANKTVDLVDLLALAKRAIAG